MNQDGQITPEEMNNLMSERSTALRKLKMWTECEMLLEVMCRGMCEVCVRGRKGHGMNAARESGI